MIKLNKIAFVFFWVASAVILVINDPSENNLTAGKILSALVFGLLSAFLFKFILEKGSAWMYKNYGSNKTQTKH